jgi:hypothetical protein
LVSQPALSAPKVSKNAPPHNNRESGEATKLVAFRLLLPVGLAFFFSFISILWLTAFRPTPHAQINNADLASGQVPLDTDHVSVAGYDNHDSISQVFTKEIQYWAAEIQSWATQFSLDPNLVAVVMQIESCGHPEIQSSAGALGLFQVMPFHFTNGEHALDPAINALRGLSYLAGSLEISGGSPGLALAGYNGGHSVISWDPMLWPDETSRYVYWGGGILEDIRAGFSQSPRLMEWLYNGGSSLCSQAAEALDM